MMFEPTDKVLVENDFIIDSTESNIYTNGIDDPQAPPSALDVECHVRMEHNPPTCRCPKNVFSWKFYWDECCMAMITLFLTLPIIGSFTLIALLNTAKRRFTMSCEKPPHQRRLNALKVDEDITQDETYYAGRWGYECQQYSIRTKDGYILKMYRFSVKGQHYLDSEPRKPVLIGHGLFQCSGDFILNEKDSLVFILVNQGYDVWTGNNRAVGCTEHVSLSENDPCYWNWGLKELGLYDLPAMLDHISITTGYKKVGYIGHSQGNALAFIALSLQPELANKLSCFIALAPAVVSGPLVTTFPLRLLIHLNKKTFRFLFGKKAFLGMMSTAQRHLPPLIMSTLAYSVFSYLFAWWDHHWVQRRKIKYFQYTPRPVSTRLLMDWLEGWGQQGVCLHINQMSDGCNTTDKAAERTSLEKVPLAIIYGADDYLVDGASFVRSFEGYENHGLMEDEWRHLGQNQRRRQLHQSPPRYAFSFPTLQLVLVKRIPGYEHMDTIWAHDNTTTSFPAIIDVLDKASWTPTPS